MLLLPVLPVWGVVLEVEMQQALLVAILFLHLLGRLFNASKRRGRSCHEMVVALVVVMAAQRGKAQQLAACRPQDAHHPLAQQQPMGASQSPAKGGNGPQLYYLQLEEVPGGAAAVGA